MNGGSIHEGVRDGETLGDKESDKLERLIHIKRHPNGGASVVHLYQDDLDHLSQGQVQRLAHVFFRCVQPLTSDL